MTKDFYTAVKTLNNLVKTQKQLNKEYFSGDKIMNLDDHDSQENDLLYDMISQSQEIIECCLARITTNHGMTEETFHELFRRTLKLMYPTD